MITVDVTIGYYAECVGDNSYIHVVKCQGIQMTFVFTCTLIGLCR